MALTTNPDDSCINEIVKEGPRVGQQECYLVLSNEERAKGFVRPIRRSYRHIKCGTITTVADEIAETYARDPGFYDGTFCVSCGTHFRLVINGQRQFVWDNGSEQGVGE